MKSFYRLLFVSWVLLSWNASANDVEIVNTEDGFKLVVDGQAFLIKGMNWDYFPIGTNYTYSLWQQPDQFIESVLEKEMTLVKNMGVNVLRIYTGIPKKWISYIYKRFGIYTMLNHPLGRYGVSIDGAWMSNTAYDDPKVRELLLKEVTQLAQEYEDTPGLLLYLLGNENNYGLFWEGVETEDIPQENKPLLDTRAMYKLFLLDNEKNGDADQHDRDLSIEELAAVRAKAMYSLFNEAALAMKSIDASHPIAMCNGDLMFIDIIKEECPDIDIFGTNVYRGISFGDTFQRVKLSLDKPMMFTEVGADAFNAITEEEDGESQAYYLIGNWKEIYTNVAGIGGAGNSIGGFTFQFSDGWWKVDQESNLDVHDISSSWNNGGYYRDHKEGLNNMNEEWFGVCAKVATKSPYEYQLRPRAAYFVLKEAHGFLPYDDNASLVDLESHFGEIELERAIKASEDYAETLNQN